MTEIKKSARFSLFSATVAGNRSAVDAFDCSPARIKQIRKRYSKVANNKALKSQVVKVKRNMNITQRPPIAIIKWRKA